ncbi:MAG: SIR2 family protein [Marinomonas sp.]
MPAESILDSLKTLPDYPTLERFASVLWQKDNAYHGAAVMVGAGFSRCAGVAGDKSKKLPLWFDLSKVLKKELNSSDSDPLRIAEEYSAYFGRQALDDLLKKEVNDAAWEPSDLHNQLLELPWSEVLTTNWDTLLEKASEKAHGRFYGVVNRQEQLSSEYSPRIVKLHGTLNVTNELIFTQEDYRTYPQKHAAFVNFARQVFIENELCLVGFSGDDPNFLQWTGWVRDHLASNARRIYLVGALDLTVAKRKYLESINISPIDLEPLVSDYDHDLKHKKATEYFLAALKELEPKKPWEWRHSNLDRKLSLEESLPTLKKNRETYPGWLILPSHLQWILQFSVDKVRLIALSDEVRAEILYEIVWQYERTYEVSPKWLIQEMFQVCDPSKPNILTKKQQLEIAVYVLKNTRWFGEEESEILEKEVITIIESNSQYWPEALEEVVFFKASLALYQFDYEKLESLVKNMAPNEPINKLRKAALLGELGVFSEGNTLISEAYKDLLSQHRRDPNSIYILSRLKVAETIQRVTTHEFKKKTVESGSEKYCELWDQIDELRKTMRDLIDKKKKNQGIKVFFTPGTYRDNSDNTTFYNRVHPFYIFHGILFSTGVPVRWDYTGFMTGLAQDLIYLGDTSKNEYFPLLARYVNSEKEDEIDYVFSRLRIASLSQSESDDLILQCERAVAYWRKRLLIPEKSNDSVLTKLRLFIEVLARVSVRAAPEKAKQLYLYALEMGSQKEMQDFWLKDSIDHLIEYSLESTSLSDHQNLLRKTLEFPIVTELQGRSLHGWPNPTIKHVGQRKPDLELDKRVNWLIESVSNAESKGSSLERLLPLIEHGFLTQSELEQLTRKIWGTDDHPNVLPNMGNLYSWVFLLLPSNNQEHTKKLVRDYLFKADQKQLFNKNRLVNIISAAQVKSIRQLPNEKEAKHYFSTLVNWRLKPFSEQSTMSLHRDDRSNYSYIAQALSYSVMPALAQTDLNEDNFEELFSFFKDTKLPASLIAFPYFAEALEEKVYIVENLLRNSLLDSDHHFVSQAAIAILKWRELENSDAVKRLISLIVTMISYNQTSNMYRLLWAVNSMLSKGYLSETDSLILCDSAPRVFDSMSYSQDFLNEIQIANIPLVRAECVKLAIGLLKMDDDKESNFHLKRIIEEAKTDPLPEVRFAAEQ